MNNNIVLSYITLTLFYYYLCFYFVGCKSFFRTLFFVYLSLNCRVKIFQEKSLVLTQPNFFFLSIFRELLLNNNLLRVLPYEIGKLFHLHILGLHGNQLGKDIMSIYNEINGTHKLLTYMLDNLTGELYFTFFIYFI